MSESSNNILWRAGIYFDSLRMQPNAFSANVSKAKSYDIQVSVNGTTWTTIWSKSDGYKNMGSVESLLNDVTCQYIRMQGRERATEWGYSIWEMKVYGTKVEPSNTMSRKNRMGRKKRKWIDSLLRKVESSEKYVLAADGSITTGNSLCRHPWEKWAEYPPECKSYSYSSLRQLTMKNLARKYHPGVRNDIDTYRSKLLRSAMHALPHERLSHQLRNHSTWKIIGLTQRIKRRSWLNLNDVIAHCNAFYNAHQILCVDVNVERLPSANSSNPLQAEYEQLLMHQSLNALIGIHGAQLTQGVLLPPNATVVELLPWVPEDDYFGTGREVWGE